MSNLKKASSFTIKGRHFLLNGEPFVIRCGEIHYSRVPKEYWRHRLELARAMGLNTVCVYLFWNYHEESYGVFNFSGDKDVSAFCSLAQELGLWVILRPVPYSCAEWDFGGLPAYLLRDPHIQLRCSYPGFLKPAQRYLKEVAKHLVSHQVSHGGNVLMVQIENEYGVYGNDKKYLESLRKTLRDSGFDVPFFRCDWANPAQLVPGAMDETAERIVTVANFGSKAAENIQALAKAYPENPRMCGEYWMGWFDWFGHPRNGKEAEDGEKNLPDLDWMLAEDVSFSLYMFHGGTTFGFYPGANNDGGKRYDPYVSSYDFFAPVDEQGRPRPKYYKFRDKIAAHLQRELPPPPAPLPVITIPRFELTHSAPLLDYPTQTHQAIAPLTMEQFDQAHGCILYRTDLTGRAAGTAELRVKDVHDYAIAYLNGNPIGTLDRHQHQNTLPLTIPKEGPAILDILVEAMGRVNFGPSMRDEVKGITNRVEYGWLTLFDWEIKNYPLDANNLASVAFQPGPFPAGRPGFYRGTFSVKEPGDTFLDLRGWGKGYVWVNDHLLGRYWSIGPQQTLYLPGVWLKSGDNTITVLDLHGASLDRGVAGLNYSILDRVKASET
jgi:beta-galactosidase